MPFEDPGSGLEHISGPITIGPPPTAAPVQAPMPTSTQIAPGEATPATRVNPTASAPPSPAPVGGGIGATASSPGIQLASTASVGGSAALPPTPILPPSSTPANPPGEFQGTYFDAGNYLWQDGQIIKTPDGSDPSGSNPPGEVARGLQRGSTKPTAWVYNRLNQSWSRDWVETPWGYWAQRGSSESLQDESRNPKWNPAGSGSGSGSGSGAGGGTTLPPGVPPGGTTGSGSPVPITGSTPPGYSLAVPRFLSFSTVGRDSNLQFERAQFANQLPPVTQHGAQTSYSPTRTDLAKLLGVGPLASILPSAAPITQEAVGGRPIRGSNVNRIVSPGPIRVGRI